MVLNKKSESGNLLLNIFRIIPVIIIMMFILNLFFGRIPQVLDNYDKIDYYFMGRRILTTDLTTSSFSVIDYESISERNIRNLFLTNDFNVCYNISYYHRSVLESEYICSSEIDSSFYEAYKEINEGGDRFNSRYNFFEYYGNIEIDGIIKPAKVEAIFYG